MVEVHHRMPDGAECVFNPRTGCFDVPVERWKRRAEKEVKAK
jgi:hypothetical protein